MIRANSCSVSTATSNSRGALAFAGILALMALFTTNPATAIDLFSPRPEATVEASQIDQYRSDPTASQVTIVEVPIASLQTGITLDLSLDGKTRTPLVDVRVDRRSPDDFSWSATDENQRSSVNIVVKNGSIVGSIRVGKDLFRLRPIGPGIAALVAVDQTKFPSEHPPGFEGGFQQKAPRKLGEDINPGAAHDTAAEYTAIVAYTAAAKSYAGNIDALIQLAQDETNQAYARSGVTTRVRVVKGYQTSYSESGNMSTDLSRFRGIGDGYAEEVHPQRDAYAADVAILLTYAFDYCGLASVIQANASTSFAVVAVSCATGYYSFAHEIGHLQGARHNPEVDASTSPFAYGHGQRDDIGGWRTIMAYDCPASCPRIQNFSNPDVNYFGRATGTAAVKNNARVLNETALAVANFRSGGSTPSWRAWESFAGTLASPPECLSSSASQTDCWAKLSSGALGWWRYNGTAAPAAVSLGGQVQTAANCLYAGGKLHCFVQLVSNQLGQITLTGSSWGAWKSLGDNIRRRPSCASPDGSKIVCVAVNASNKLRTRTWSGTAWGAWSALAANLTVSEPPTCYPRAGGVDCVVADTANRFQYLRRNGSGSWAASKNLAGSVTGIASCNETSTTTRACFILGTDSTVRRIYFNGTQWSGWENIGGSLAAAPSCLLLGGTQANCFGVASDGTLRQTTKSGGAWSPWTSLGGALAISRPACVAPTGARIDCFARGSGNALAHRAYY